MNKDVHVPLILKLVFEGNPRESRSSSIPPFLIKMCSKLVVHYFDISASNQKPYRERVERVDGDFRFVRGKGFFPVWDIRMLCSGTPDRDGADIRRVMAWCGLFIMGGVLKVKCQN